MQADIGTRYRTGEICSKSGRYTYAGYLDGSSRPEPARVETIVALREGESFPPVRSYGKPCWWILAEETPPLACEDELRMVSEGGPAISGE